LNRLGGRIDALTNGRGYLAVDLPLIASVGMSCGCLCILVLALYVNSDQVRTLYRYPMLLLLVCPLLLYWICRLWMVAQRGQMHNDPIVFALSDRVSYIIGLLTLVILWSAT
jgi:4-hydroxybenzoate polyprenyltransferase